MSCITLTVFSDPPAGVSVMGPPSAAPGSLLTVQCQSYPSVPEASLHWAVVQDRERVEYTTENMVDHMEDGSYTTRSVLEFQAGQGGDVAVECFAKHEVLGENTKAHAHVIIISKNSIGADILPSFYLTKYAVRRGIVVPIMIAERMNYYWI